MSSSFLRPDIIVNEIKGAELRTINRAMLQARKLSSGKYKAWRLAKLGHPYSVRNSGGWVPYNDPAYINIQSGNFYWSWLRKPPVLKGGNIESEITNTAEYADKLALGISGLTIRRPLIARVRTTVDYWRMRELAKGIRNAIQIHKS